MKISIITVCYNASAVIETCLQSAAEQTHPDIEHIVIDGRSTDGTVAAVRRYPHVATLVSESDQGIYDAMNKGLDHVTGEYVIFLNADDKFASAKALARGAAAIERNPGGDVYYGWLEVRPLDGAPVVFRPPPPAEAPTLMICGCLPHQSTLARPSVFAKTGRFDLRYRCHSDYDWFLKILADPAIDVRSIDVAIGSFQEGGISSQLAAGQPEVYAIQNRSPMYATPDWDKKRIVALQQALLQERIETDRLRGEIRTMRALGVQRADAPRDPAFGGPVKTGWRVTADAARSATGEFRDTVQTRLRRRMLEACVRYLPRRAVDVLRRLRARGRGMRAGRRHARL